MHLKAHTNLNTATERNGCDKRATESKRRRTNGKNEEKNRRFSIFKSAFIFNMSISLRLAPSQLLFATSPRARTHCTLAHSTHLFCFGRLFFSSFRIIFRSCCCFLLNICSHFRAKLVCAQRNADSAADGRTTTYASSPDITQSIIIYLLLLSHLSVCFFLVHHLSFRCTAQWCGDHSRQPK